MKQSNIYVFYDLFYLDDSYDDNYICYHICHENQTVGFGVIYLYNFY